jgi:intracellular sulfur oxidation DsrE/DsrF family protein
MKASEFVRKGLASGLALVAMGVCATTHQAPAAAEKPVVVAQAAAATPAAPAMARVVWHVDFGDPRRLSAMIQNVNNMVTTYQNDLADYDVRVVFLAGGIRFVTEDDLARTPFAANKAFRAERPQLIKRLQQLRELHGVKLELCDITREALRLPKEKIIPGVASVRSGVVRIAELQSQGFAYLKVE